ncbi:MAG: hypothetical protein KJ879_02085 [Nanoarchaeota archaeon]|nr:hypothetical protein [Nanoarchaeota archaeon]
MLKKFLKEVITIVVGKNAEEIVEFLDTKKHVNEFIISKKLDLTINQTRNILYKISDQGLVSSIRKKDKRKGWYTYFWKIEVLKSLEFLRNDLMKKIEQLENQVRSRETKRFYVCDTCHIEITEENALSNNFTCNECGSIFVFKDNTKILKEMKRALEKLKNDLGLVDNEISIESKKVEVGKMKVINKEEKEKKKVRETKRLERKVVRDKLKKAAGKTKKKTPAKKSKKVDKKKKPKSKSKSAKKPKSKTLKRKSKAKGKK